MLLRTMPHQTKSQNDDRINLFIPFGFFLLALGFFFVPHGASASTAVNTIYAPGDTVTLGDFVYNDDYSPSTSDNCTITVYDPTGALIVNAQSLTPDSNGWHHYTLPSPVTTLGTWPAFMSCGSSGTGDLVNESLSFQVTDYAVSSSTVATLVNAHTDTALQTATSSVAAVVNANTNTASSSLAASLPSSIWSFTGRTLDNVDNIATAVWGYVSGAGRSLTSALIGGSPLALQSDILTASSSLAAVVNGNTNTATANETTNVNANTNTALANASSSVVALVNANTNTASSSVVAQLASAITSIPGNVWSSSTRTLTSFGTLAADVWNATNRTLTSLSLTSSNPWVVSMSDSNTVAAGSTYHVTVTTVDNGTLTDSMNTPTITIYDPSHNTIVNAAAMTRSGTGTYQYSYATSGSAPAGTWESDVNATVQSGQTLPSISYWNLTTSPAQVIIRNVSGTTVPNISADVTITNEGNADYEYQYEWCVVSDINNACGGGDDTFYSSAAKFIPAKVNPDDGRQNFDTTLTATVPNPGTYYFKVLVFFGSQESGSSRQFTATGNNSNGGGNNNSGGGGGGGGSGGGGGGGGNGSATVLMALPPAAAGACKGADLNGDNKVNTIDFSILLSFWKKSPPFKNACVDINHDGKVNAQDFSILLSQWGTVGKALSSS